MKLHIIMHEYFEGPAAIELWANRNKHQITYTRLYLREPFHLTCDFDFLIVMGGPQSPATTLTECSHFDVAKEIRFIQKSIQQNKILLGICLGAQLIGEALGAKFAHSPNREIGVFEITMTDASQRDPIFSTFPQKFGVGHWHGDMPGLTADAEILATSNGCPRQIVKYGPRLYGFQCHFEFTPNAIEQMIKNCSHELEEYQNSPYVQNAQELRNQNYSQINALLFQFLDAIVRLPA